MKCLKLLILCSIFVISSSRIIQAEENGRLKNGQAFRIDQQGYRLVDELAELQVKNRELAERVATLEGQIEDSALNVQETKLECPKQSCPNIQARDCRGEIELLQKELGQTKLELSDRPTVAQLQKLMQERDSAVTQALSVSERNQLARKEIENSHERELADFRTKMKGLEEETSKKANESLTQKEKAAQLQDELSRLKTSELALKQTVESLSAKIESQAQLLAKTQSIAANKDAQIAKLENTSRNETDQRAMLKRDIHQTVEQVRNQVQLSTTPTSYTTVSLQQIQQLVLKRKDLRDSLKGSVQNIELSPLKTRGGLTLDVIRARIANNEVSLDEMGGELLQLRAVLDQDIELLQRLQHIR
jgi:archaellum component FlaC